MNILELKFNAGKSNGGSGGGSADLGEVWNALGGVLDTIDALADKLTNATTTTSDSDQPVLDGPGLME